MRIDTIVFTLYRRPFYARSVLNAWKQVREVKNWRCDFHIDPSDQTQAQVKWASEFLNWHGNGSVEVHETRKGVSEAPFYALKKAFDAGAPRVVLAEEDVEPADDALEYLTAALYYANIACAWSDEDGAEDTYKLRKWFNPWLWATDSHTWYGELEDTWDKDYSTADERGPAGWDSNIGLRLVHDQCLDVAFPTASRSRHIGKHLGVHQDPSQFGETEMPKSFKAHREPVYDWIWDGRPHG